MARHRRTFTHVGDAVAAFLPTAGIPINQTDTEVPPMADQPTIPWQSRVNDAMSCLRDARGRAKSDPERAESGIAGAITWLTEALEENPQNTTPVLMRLRTDGDWTEVTDLGDWLFEQVNHDSLADCKAILTSVDRMGEGEWTGIVFERVTDAETFTAALAALETSDQYNRVIAGELVRLLNTGTDVLDALEAVGLDEDDGDVYGENSEAFAIDDADNDLLDLPARRDGGIGIILRRPERAKGSAARGDDEPGRQWAIAQEYSHATTGANA